VASDFLKNLNRELDRLSVPGADRGKERPARRRKQSSIPGEPNSPERMQYVASQIEDPNLRGQLVSELAWESVGTHLRNALHLIHADEAREDFYDYDQPNYRQETLEAFASAARMLGRVPDPQLFAAFQSELGEDSPLQELLAPVVQNEVEFGAFENYEVARAHQQSRMDERERLLSEEYREIERTTGRAGLEGADQLAHMLAAENLLYDPQADELQLRGQLRSTAETAAATDWGLKQAAFLTEFDREAARRYGPGSSWNDQEREKWESELRMGTVETVERAFGDPADQANRAVDRIIDADQRRATGKSALERGLDAEFERMAQHDSRAPHKRAMATENVKEYEATHTARGEPTTVRDGYDREVGGRYDS
jgi:hypothetical protein